MKNAFLVTGNEYLRRRAPSSGKNFVDRLKSASCVWRLWSPNGSHCAISSSLFNVLMLSAFYCHYDVCFAGWQGSATLISLIFVTLCSHLWKLPDTSCRRDFQHSYELFSTSCSYWIIRICTNTQKPFRMYHLEHIYCWHWICVYPFNIHRLWAELEISFDPAQVHDRHDSSEWNSHVSIEQQMRWIIFEAMQWCSKVDTFIATSTMCVAGKNDSGLRISLFHAKSIPFQFPWFGDEIKNTVQRTLSENHRRQRLKPAKRPTNVQLHLMHHRPDNFLRSSVSATD